ncbi:MAG: class I SAM-dependent methyltransferase [Gemmatimonadetes bacterium]|uniref:Class I SAM-dependent methyltransferase n=1 Tax=Candidatus Kutchimonas denitrificans TaxID=3056748 RepID=A0AAE5CCH5_9BACT|nr:class I SAM-dependent methyltransferase [Gemmatimonadota bacterium]NIR75933.1 class I SAM-dependent methyltransferase [Candidatus Kutchimonas denitrificans]NIS02091.1 class I SAM-dependent methyltransferase [Gemmatimonadota bacterium]NIT67916.1 class I SAM-dependent methyltransferase [Gemmatimonadota bacterium]NIU53910.1 methyltransferase domain-containing protein [Gemmatimonadota bacterium]
MSRKSHWEQIYATRSAEQLSWHQDRPELSLRLIRACATARETRIIDVGGGSSTLVDHLIDTGYTNVAVLDLAQHPLDQASARLGDRARAVEWIIADLTRFDPPHTWDIWHDRAFFHFLTEPEERNRYRNTLTKALVPGGHAIIATFAPTGPERCSGLDVVRYSAESLLDELGPEFELLNACEERHTTPDGVIQPFTYGLLRRSGPGS